MTKIITGQAIAEHEDLIAAVDIESKKKSRADSASIQKKRLVSQVLLECLQIDKEQGANMLEMYRDWLAHIEHPNTDTLRTLDEYLVFRRQNIGAK
jgi:ophiobolin F synthase